MLFRRVEQFLKESKEKENVWPRQHTNGVLYVLEDRARSVILEICNEHWNSGTFPVEKLKAYVASICKKGDPLHASNYRPISLLDSIYKVFTGMIQMRLSETTDPDISRLQFDFRKGKSTSTPIACIRRLVDRAEASKNPFCSTFLDWEKAFDRIKQDKLIEALERMRSPSSQADL